MSTPDSTFSAISGSDAVGIPSFCDSITVGAKLTASSHWPEITVLARQDQMLALGMHIHPELLWFSGHFVGQPVLPGVVQTHWAGLLAQGVFARNTTRKAALQFQQLLKLKFNAVVKPDQHLQLQLTWQAARSQCLFAYQNGQQQPVSSGTIRFASS